MSVLSVSPRAAVVYDPREDCYKLVYVRQMIAGQMIAFRALRLPRDMSAAIIGLLSDKALEELAPDIRSQLEVFEPPKTDDR